MKICISFVEHLKTHGHSAVLVECIVKNFLKVNFVNCSKFFHFVDLEILLLPMEIINEGLKYNLVFKIFLKFPSQVFILF
jgi:hypothetical protein